MSVKLVVVAGPNRGATYFLEEGENSLGRAPENQVVLASPQVSKRHCALVCNGPKAELVDLGSSNGTFVNGVLTKKRLLQTHDRISLGPFVLEVLLPEAPALRLNSSFGQVAAGGAAPGGMAPVTIDPGHFKMEQEPKSLIGKYKKKFDDVFLPVVYDFYERTDYPTLLASMFGIYVVLNLGFSVYPVLQKSREEVLRQAEHQALYISSQVAYLNRQNILEGKEGALITDFAETEINVKEVTIANLEGRIMAPGSRLNESFNNPTFLRYRDLLQKNNSLWGKPRIVRNNDREEVIAFTPIMVLSKSKGINVPGAVATVIYSTAGVSLDMSTVATVYLEALFWSFMLGVVFLYLMYSVTHKPLEKLTDDMDKVLKGEADSVEKKYKNDLIDQLIDTVNSALSRIPKNDSGGQEDMAGGDQERLIIDNMTRQVEFVASRSTGPVMMLDAEMRVKLTNEAFEELTGIRGAQGEVIDTVSRDESFPSLVKEMAENARSAGNDGVSEEYDFPSGGFRIHAVAIGGMPGAAEAFLYLFEKQGD
jgi:hypothetical protein